MRCETIISWEVNLLHEVQKYMEWQMWQFEMQRTDSKEEEYSVTFTQLRVPQHVWCGLKSAHPSPFSKCLPSINTDWESEEKGGMLFRIQVTPVGVGGQHTVHTGRGEFSLNGMQQNHAVEIACILQ